jgi:copper(I)-binding protein
MSFRTLFARLLVVTLGAVALTSCGAEEPDFGDSPGANVEAGDVAVRYAHLEDPEDADRYPSGADVPFYVWLLNESDDVVQLTTVSAELSDSVALTYGQLPVELPPGELVALGPDGRHFVLEGIDREIRAQDLIPVELTFSDGASAEIEVEAIEVDPAEMDLVS